ncbi:MAG: hypothetical protein H6Q72_1909 [Firmicutes bacterium]|nr:hypothetical protein [Bacillota bacterium]
MEKMVVHVGNRCNAACQYCHCPKSGDEFTLSPLLLSVLADKTHGAQLCVRFIGGEPTLYMPQIEKIVSVCSSVTEFVVSTNGLLLSDKQRIDFFNTHNFFVAVSYDGKQGKRAYRDIFESASHIENIKKLKRLGCSTTLDSDNLNFGQLFKEFGRIENKIQRPLRLRPHLIHCLGVDNDYLSLADVQVFADQYKQIVGNFIDDYIHYGLVNTKFFNMFYYLFTTIENYYIFPESRCYSKKTIQTNLAGKQYICPYCQTLENYLGSLDENQELVFLRLADKVEKRRPACMRCELYCFCGTYCLASKHPEIECKIQQELIPWFLNTISKYGIARFSKLKQYGGLI